MSSSPSDHPAPRGLLAISTSGSAEEWKAIDDLAPRQVGGIELRGDLFLEAGDPGEEAMWNHLRELRSRGFPVLFTVRLPDHGGVYRGDESRRVELYRQSLAHGAGLVDAEWGSEAAIELSRSGAPLVVSHHDFSGPLSAQELERLSGEMASLNPRGIKIIPTARTLGDGMDCLDWVSGRETGQPTRIGFAMGAAGAFTRILALSRGSEFTYAGLTGAVAPGQVPLEELIEVYRPREIQPDCKVLGVLGSHALTSFSPYLHNPSLYQRKIPAIYLPFQAESFPEMVEIWDRLPVHGLSVTIPFKEDARAFAREIDARSEKAGASNTLVRVGESARAFNTDFDGVILPLRSHHPRLTGLSVGIIGAGGAARGAAEALREAGANPTLYYRNIERGNPVAGELGVPGRTIDRIRPGEHRAWINATPVGGQAGDPSPVPESVFSSEAGEPGRNLTAFDMVYQPSITPFLEMARRHGAGVIRGREMLVAQGTVQFELFTGQEVSLEEFARNYGHGEDLRARNSGSGN